MPTITADTSFTLTAGKALVFDKGGNALVTVDPGGRDRRFIVGPQRVEMGSWTTDVVVVVKVNSGTISYTVDEDGDLSDQSDPFQRISEKLSETISFFDFLTPSQAQAVRTNNYSGVNITEFTDAVQSAFNAAFGKRLNISSPAFIKVNRPVVWLGRTEVSGGSVADGDIGVVFYPDLSVNWPVLYPDQGVLTADKYLFGFPGFPEITAGFWTGSGRGFQVRADKDPIFLSSKVNVPDYGICLWSQNEDSYFERVQVFKFRKHNWFLGGVSSVSTLVHCNGSDAGIGQNTIFGDAVSRPASPFSDNVYVYWANDGTNVLFLEAAASSDLDTLAVSDILSINGSNYTVSTVPAVTQSINERTVIGGVVTTARFVRRVTISSNISARGRVYHAGIAFGNHPRLDFAPGVISAAGGRGNFGTTRLLGFSGDNNSALIFMDGSHSLAVLSPKSEGNNSLVHISGDKTGGAKGRIEVSAYRADGFGTFDGGMIRITGNARPSVVLGTGQVVDYSNILNDETPNSQAEKVTRASFYGQGMMHYGTDNTEYPSFTSLRAKELTVGGQFSNGANLFVVDGADATNRRMQVSVSNISDIYRMRVGPGPANVFSVSSNNGNNTYLWAYNGTATEKLLRLYQVGSIAGIQIGQSATQAVGFYGSTPVAKQTVSGSKGGNLALADLIAKLAALGLIVDSTT